MQIGSSRIAVLNMLVRVPSGLDVEYLAIHSVTFMFEYVLARYAGYDKDIAEMGATAFSRDLMYHK